ncbi:hypothetical protein KC345_g11978, partial [Hortaea werneckii]
MFERYIEKEIIPLGERKGIGQVVFSPLAQGLLTGKYSSVADIPADSRAAKLDWMRKGITEEKIAKVQELGSIAAELDLSVGNLALAWILRQPNVASALVGASRPEQVEENVKASGIELTEDMKVLFIGGTGLISQAVSRLAVKQGIELYLFNRGERSGFVPEGAQVIQGDIRDKEKAAEALKGYEFDVVADWIAFTPEHVQTDIELFTGKTKQYIYISSASAYQKPQQSYLITEETPL